MTTDGPNHSLNTNSGQSVNVLIGGEGVNKIIVAFLAVIIVLLLTVPVSISATMQARAAKETADTASTEARQWAYWGERAELACQAAGVKMPDLPLQRRK